MAGKQLATQRAGEVSRLIPSVTITRGTSSLNAAEKLAVDWQDIINTQASARARISLDDGSLLNLGSDSVMQVVKHDAGSQQTALELVSGKMRVQAKKLTIPGAKFEVRTPSGVAGVVGTDFYLAYDDDAMTVMVFEGQVRVCNLSGVCVEVGAGQTTTVRHSDQSGPAQPAPAPESLLSAARDTTSVEAKPANASVGIVSKSISAHIGNHAATEGETVFSGDALTTEADGSLEIRAGSLALKLESNSSVYIYSAPYGVVAELSRGSIVYDRPAGPQNLVIVASDIRVTPALSTADLGRVKVEDPCKISITSQRGSASVRVGSETKAVESGKAYLVAAEYSVSAQEFRSPDANDYHTSHYHRPCQAQVAQGSRNRGPLYQGRSHFAYLATGTVILVTVIPLLEAFESPHRP